MNLEAIALLLGVLVPLISLMGWHYRTTEKKAEIRDKKLREDLQQWKTDLKQEISKDFEAFKQDVRKEFEAFKQDIRKEFEAFKQEISQKQDGLETRFSKEIQELKQEIQEIKRILATMHDRLTKLETRFEERSYWEARLWKKNGTEDGIR